MITDGQLMDMVLAYTGSTVDELGYSMELHCEGMKRALAVIDIHQYKNRSTLDYDAVKRYYAETLAADPVGFGRMEAAFLKTVEMIFQRGITVGAEAERLRLQNELANVTFNQDH